MAASVRRARFHHTSFRRSVALPAGATVDEIKATFDEGVLEVRVPAVAQAPAPTKVLVTSG